MAADADAKDIIRAAVQVIMEPILDMLQSDPHGWSSRPCSTCDTITAMMGKPFGCAKYRIDKAGK